MGTTGESATTTAEEKAEILSFIKKNNPKKLPIVYGIGGNNTEHVLTTIEETDLRGVTAILSVSPYYNKPSQAGIRLHFEKVADQSPVPVILYNVPGRTASNLTVETTLVLAQHPNIIGIKEASGNLEQCMQISNKMPSGFLLLSGDDLLSLPIYALGGKGVISVLANAYPDVFSKMWAATQTGNFDKAKKEQFKLLDINGPMYEEGNPVGVKYLLSKMKVSLPYTRLPLTMPSDSLKKKIDQAFRQLK
jgi:4-hydroxy-tetrahydrodipicolinate synthase